MIYQDYYNIYIKWHYCEGDAMRSMKRIVSLVLLTVMTVCTACACSHGTGTSGLVMEASDNGGVRLDKNAAAYGFYHYDEELLDIIPKETVTLEVWSPLLNYDNCYQIGWFAEVLYKKFNVKLRYLDHTDEAVKDRAIAGELGDILIWGDDTGDYQTAARNGSLVDWESNGLLDSYGSDIARDMGSALDRNRIISGGKIYGFGYDVAYASGNVGSFDYHPDIRWDLYLKAGCPPIRTLEDYVPALAAMKKLNPVDDDGNEVWGAPLFPDWDGSMVMYVKATATNFFGVDEFGIGFYDPDDGSFIGCLEDGGYYLRCLKFYNSLYRAGLIDPAARSSSYDSTAQGYRSGRYLFSIFSWLGSNEYNTAEHLIEGKAMLPVAADDQDTLVYGLSEYGGARIWSISSHSRYPELCMAIINWLCTSEGRLTMEYGPRGLGWDLGDDNMAYLLDAGFNGTYGSDFDIDPATGYSGTWKGGIPLLNNTTWSLYSVRPDNPHQSFDANTWAGVAQKGMSDIEQRWCNYFGVSSEWEYMTRHEYTVSRPNTYVASDMPQVLYDELPALTQVVKDYSWKAIMADSDEEYDRLVDEMKEAASQLRYDEYADYYTIEASRRKAAER